MGNLTIIDIIGSAIVAGVLFISIFNLCGFVTISSATQNLSVITHENLITLARIVETDFRKLGYNNDPAKPIDPSKAIIKATPDTITFLSDIDKNGIADTLSYYSGSTNLAKSTPNPHDFPIYRAVGKSAKEMRLGVIKFKFTYFDSNNDSLAFPITKAGTVYSVRLAVMLENPYAYDSVYTQSYWGEMRLATRNLKNR